MTFFARNIKTLQARLPIKTISPYSLSKKTTQIISPRPLSTTKISQAAPTPALKMHAALVTEWTSPPAFTTVPDPPAPTADEIQLRVLAAGIHRVVRSRAAGEHYSAHTLPHLPGIDGVGEDPATGQRYYFVSFATGSFVERVNVEKRAVRPLPAGADPIAVAALMNPAMSGWMALSARTTGLEKGFSVVVLGVTSASGKIAVDVARAQGAGRIVGVARSEAKMAAIDGLDERIVLKDKPEETDWSKMGEVDVVLDYVYGTPAVALLSALPPSIKEVQYVQIGSLSGELEVPISSALLRSKRIALRGSGPGAWTMKEMGMQVAAGLEAVAKVKAENVVTVPLEDIGKVWNDKSLGDKRIVLVPGEA